MTIFNIGFFKAQGATRPPGIYALVMEASLHGIMFLQMGPKYFVVIKMVKNLHLNRFENIRRDLITFLIMSATPDLVDYFMPMPFYEHSLMDQFAAMFRFIRE